MAPFFQPNYFDYVLIGLICGIVWAGTVYVLWLHFFGDRGKARSEKPAGDAAEEAGPNSGSPPS